MKKFSLVLYYAILTLSILNFNLSPVRAESVSFSDVSMHFWGYGAIQWAVENKIIDGYPDGTFKPDQNVDQNEFLAMLIRAYQPSDFTPNKDSSDWAAPYSRYAGKMGWSLITPSPLMGHPTNHIGLSRWMVAKYLANAAGGEQGDKVYTISTPGDVNYDHAMRS